VARPKGRRRIRKLRLFALLALLAVLGLASFSVGLVTAIAGEIPSLDPSRIHNQTDGFIYANNGRVLSVLRGSQSRILLRSDQISPLMKQAIVAIEDKRFYEHRGVDVRGIMRALWADVRGGGAVQGGSTITQQFVKNTYTKNQRSIARKLREAALAWQLEQRWSKDRILTAYLNTIYFGNGAYGIEMAARVYFHSHASALTLPQAALLAGLPASPGAYDPVENPARARLRRATVLNLMVAQGLITRRDAVEANRVPLPKAKHIELPPTKSRQPYFAEYVKQQLVPYYGSGGVFGSGLKIYTSIDLDLQRLAQEAIDRTLAGKGGPAASLVAIDPRDGRVLAMVGGRSFKKSQFNLAVQGERQAGSAFKPFVLATALSQGISPQTVFTSKPTVINLGDKLWAVNNYENSYLGSIDLNEATTFSDNAVYAQLTAQVGPRNVARMASRLGITSHLNDYFAIGLGVNAVNPLEMARAFATFANGGERIDGSLLGNEPRAVMRVVDGKRTDRNDPVERPVFDPNNDAILTSMLEDVVSSGTGKRAALPDRPAAGKTGTTENYGDAWFVGYTPQLAVAVWVGYPNKLRPMLTEFEGLPVAGGTLPALIWRSFAIKALRQMREPPAYFQAPQLSYSAPRQVVYRNNRWYLDNGNCDDSRTILYFAGYGPSKQAPCKPNEVDVPRVVGARLGDARTRLLGMPLTPEVITRPAKPGEQLGRVVAQFPGHGTLSSWDTVRLVMPKSTNGRVPDVVGLNLSRARRLLAGRDLAGFVEALADGKSGVVLAQYPHAGLAAVRNMTVRLVVGRA
jgi:penicillin-binding protein 1A